MKHVITLAILFFVATSQTILGDDDNAKEQKRIMYALDNSSLPSVYIPIPGDWGRITRLPDRIKIEASLSDLDPDQVCNAHAWLFNNPTACVGSPSANARGNACSPLVDQFIPETMPSLVSFGGFIPDSSGNLHLELELRISEGFPVVPSLFETNGSFTAIVLARGDISVGLTDPMNADVGLNLARKGPIQPLNTQLQFKSVFGACGDGFILPPLFPHQLCETIRQSPVGGTLF